MHLSDLTILVATGSVLDRYTFIQYYNKSNQQRYTFLIWYITVLRNYAKYTQIFISAWFVKLIRIPNIIYFWLTRHKNGLFKCIFIIIYTFSRWTTDSLHSHSWPYLLWLKSTPTSAVLTFLLAVMEDQLELPRLLAWAKTLAISRAFGMSNPQGQSESDLTFYLDRDSFIKTDSSPMLAKTTLSNTFAFKQAYTIPLLMSAMLALRESRPRIETLLEIFVTTLWPSKTNPIATEL